MPRPNLTNLLTQPFNMNLNESLNVGASALKEEGFSEAVAARIEAQPDQFIKCCFYKMVPQ